jgi:hypothetical protein
VHKIMCKKRWQEAFVPLITMDATSLGHTPSPLFPFESTSIIWQCWKEKNCVLDTRLAIMLFFTLFNNIGQITSTINNSWISQNIANKHFVIGGARHVTTRSHSNLVITICPFQSHSLVGHDSKFEDTTFHLFWEMLQVLSNYMDWWVKNMRAFLGF